MSEPMIEVRDEYYRQPDGTVRHRRFINGKEVWDSAATVVTLDTCKWPWDRIGSSPLNAIIKEGPKAIVKPISVEER